MRGGGARGQDLALIDVLTVGWQWAKNELPSKPECPWDLNPEIFWVVVNELDMYGMMMMIIKMIVMMLNVK